MPRRDPRGGRAGQLALRRAALGLCRAAGRLPAGLLDTSSRGVPPEPPYAALADLPSTVYFLVFSDYFCTAEVCPPVIGRRPRLPR
ncbi:hypothetical protein ACFSVJ_02580 [Prauserella oleivorans]